MEDMKIAQKSDVPAQINYSVDDRPCTIIVPMDKETAERVKLIQEDRRISEECSAHPENCLKIAEREDLK